MSSPNMTVTVSVGVAVIVPIVAVVFGVSTALLVGPYIQGKTSDSKTPRRSKNTEAEESNNSKDDQKSIIGISHPFTLIDTYKGCIYLDYNATTCIFPEVTKAMMPFTSTSFGNPSSSHVYAHTCKQAIDTARDNVKYLINARKSESIYFTSCGTESDNRAIDIAIHHYKERRNKTRSSSLGSSNDIPHIITSAIEHPAILGYLQYLENGRVIELDITSVNNEGFVDTNAISQLLKANTALVTIMHSNNEVGTIQPIKSISRVIADFNQVNQTDILLHSDAAQSLGKVVVDVHALGVDMVTIVGHKFGAPKGIAALYVRDDIKYCPMLIGGGQERGMRAGTENLLLIAALGEASRIASDEGDLLLIHMLSLKLQLMKGLSQGLTDISNKLKYKDLFTFNGPKSSIHIPTVEGNLTMFKAIANSQRSNKSVSQRRSSPSRDKIGLSSVLDQLPNTVSISFRDIKAHQILPLLYDRVACSPGSACHSSDGEKISAVLKAMNVPVEYASGTLRLSLGRHTTATEIKEATSRIVDTIHRLLKEKLEV